MFDFTNYTYSGLLSLVSAVFGISYPLILDNISRIDEKYKATILTKKFLREKRYLIFKGLLIINLIMAVCIPFALSVSQSPHALLLSQTVGIILLIFSSFVLYELILTYNKPDDLFKWLKRNPDDPHCPEINELCIFLSKKDNNNLFWENWDYIAHHINKRLRESSNNGQLPTDVWDLLFRYRGVIGRDEDSSKSSRFRTFNHITPLLYPSYDDSYKPSLGTHRLIWVLINDAVVGDNKEWIVQHWSWMDQFFRSKLKYLRYDGTETKDLRDFVRLTHVMLGALLLFHRRYHTINDILFYTNVTPPEYNLLPNSLSEIDEMVGMIYCYQNRFMLLEGTFSFANMNHGVQNDASIVNESMQFLALCVIRLWSLNTSRLYEQPFQIPQIPSQFNMIEQNIQTVNLLNRCVEQWYRKDVFNLIEKLSYVEQNQVQGLLSNWNKTLLDARDDKERHPHADRELIEVFKSELHSASISPWRVLPTKEYANYPEGTDTDTVVLRESINELIDVKLFDNGFNICYTNMPDAYISFMSRPTIQKYISLLLSFRHKTKSYKIQYRDIFKAFELLSVNNDHYILNAGNYLGNYEGIYGKVDGLVSEKGSVSYNNVVIHDIDSQMMSIFIIPKYCLPYVEYLLLPETSNLKPLCDDATISSNLDDIFDSGFNSNQFILSLGRGIRINYPKNNINIVRLDVTHNTSEGSLDIDGVSW